MQESTTTTLDFPSTESKDVLTKILREGAQALLAEAVEAEVADWIDAHDHLQDEYGHRQVVRNGRLPKRKIITGVGPVEIEQPRVHDRRRADQAERFCSKILPPYLRKTRSIEELIPWLYLKGISTGDFGEALQSILGRDVPGLSASTITRLKKVWEEEYQDWSRRSLEGKQYVYLWADGVHFNIRLEEDRQCILVLMGATRDGNKELIAVADGYRESEQSWRELLLDVKARGLAVDPKLATGDGALGFWKALKKVYSKTRQQRCWVHKTANVLDKLPKRLQAAAKEKLHDVWMADTRQPSLPSLRPVSADVRAEVPQGVRVSRQGPRRALDVLRFSGRALDSPTNHQPNRIDLCHGTAANETNQRQRLPPCLSDDGLQADAIGVQELASAEWLRNPPRRNSRNPFHRRNQANPRRRLKILHPQLIAISRRAA